MISCDGGFAVESLILVGEGGRLLDIGRTREVHALGGSSRLLDEIGAEQTIGTDQGRIRESGLRDGLHQGNTVIGVEREVNDIRTLRCNGLEGAQDISSRAEVELQNAIPTELLEAVT